MLERRANYIPVERARPRIELPGPVRRTEARELAAKWHNKVVRHTNRLYGTRIGRITFTEPNALKWFRIQWTSGPEPETWHNKSILARLEVLQPDHAPPDIAPEAPAVKVWVVTEKHHWSVSTREHIEQRLQQGMPGQHPENAAFDVHNAVQSIANRNKLVVKYPPSCVDILNSAVDLTTCPVILDPWAGAAAVRKGLHVGSSRLHINEKIGCSDVHLMREPLEYHLYEEVITRCGRLDAIVMCPPERLADMALINALQYAGKVVCMHVNEKFLLSAHPARAALLAQLESLRRIVVVKDLDPACEHCWLCVFASHEERTALLRPGMEPGDSNYLLLERRHD